MDLIDAENPKFAAIKPTDQLEKRIKQFETIMSSAGIIPSGDLQAMQDRRGQLWLYDFDLYAYLDANGKLLGYDVDPESFDPPMGTRISSKTVDVQLKDLRKKYSKP